jgi:pimeloyl-ACP methyl ester carboxylesterase
MILRRVPTFLLLHGAWHDGSSWGPVPKELARLGHAAVAVDLPCDDTSATFDDYTRVALAACPAPDVVVGHSFGGYTAARIPAAVRVFLAGLVPREESGDEPLQLDPVFSTCPRRDAEGRSYWERDDALRVMYRDLPRRTGVALFATLRPQARAGPVVPVDLGAARNVYVLGSRDGVVRPEWSRWAAHEVLGVEPIELDAGHFPMFERPRELAELLAALLDT